MQVYTVANAIRVSTRNDDGLGLYLVRSFGMYSLGIGKQESNVVWEIAPLSPGEKSPDVFFSTADDKDFKAVQTKTKYVLPANVVCQNRHVTAEMLEMLGYTYTNKVVTEDWQEVKKEEEVDTRHPLERMEPGSAVPVKIVEVLQKRSEHVARWKAQLKFNPSHYVYGYVFETTPGEDLQSLVGKTLHVLVREGPFRYLVSMKKGLENMCTLVWLEGGAEKMPEITLNFEISNVIPRNDMNRDYVFQLTHCLERQPSDLRDTVPVIQTYVFVTGLGDRLPGKNKQLPVSIQDDTYPYPVVANRGIATISAAGYLPTECQNWREQDAIHPVSLEVNVEDSTFRLLGRRSDGSIVPLKGRIKTGYPSLGHLKRDIMANVYPFSDASRQWLTYTMIHGVKYEIAVDTN